MVQDREWYRAVSGTGTKLSSMLFSPSFLEALRDSVSPFAFLSAGRSKMANLVNGWRQDLSLLVSTKAEKPSEVFTRQYCFVRYNHVLGEEGTRGSTTSQHTALMQAGLQPRKLAPVSPAL